MNFNIQILFAYLKLCLSSALAEVFWLLFLRTFFLFFRGNLFFLFIVIFLWLFSHFLIFFLAQLIYSFNFLLLFLFTFVLLFLIFSSFFCFFLFFLYLECFQINFHENRAMVTSLNLSKNNRVLHHI